MKKIFTILLSVIAFAVTAQNISMPAGNTTVTQCSGTFFDSGGNGGTYGVSESRTITICPGVAGNKVNLLFTSFALENGWDFL